MSSKAKTFHVHIESDLDITTPDPLPDGITGTAYVKSLQASGGVAPYSWALTSGSLPAGLALSPTGGIQGTPTAPGDYTFTVTVTDAA